MVLGNTSGVIGYCGLQLKKGKINQLVFIQKMDKFNKKLIIIRKLF